MSTDILSDDYPDFTEFGTPPCAETNPDGYFTEDPLDGTMTYNRSVYLHERDAKMVCLTTCEYQQRCLLYALKNEDLQGIWGGANEKQRKQMREGIKVELTIPPSNHR